MLAEVMTTLAPARGGVFLDGTFGAGGYTRALLEGGADHVIGVDRDPEAIERGRAWASLYPGRLTLVEGCFASLDQIAADHGAPLEGVALDIGVSSMQIDDAARGFSFSRDGPLDMRMGGDGLNAADLVNEAPEADLARILKVYGEERAARRIARAIATARAETPIARTSQLADIIASVTPPPRPGQPHPATRSFQALRIAVNDELGELTRALFAAERALAPGGVLAVVSFHSLEDRIVKRFLQIASGHGANPSRHEPQSQPEPARFELTARKAVRSGEAETTANPRARSARLRAATRTGAGPMMIETRRLGVPELNLGPRGRR